MKEWLDLPAAVRRVGPTAWIGMVSLAAFLFATVLVVFMFAP